MGAITDLLKDCGDPRIEKAVETDAFIMELSRLSKKRKETGDKPYSMNNLVELSRIDNLIVEKVLNFFISEKELHDAEKSMR